jgi:hypothetical protein
VSYPDRAKDKRAAEEEGKKDRCHCSCRRSPPLASEVIKHPFLSSVTNFFAPFSLFRFLTILSWECSGCQPLLADSGDPCGNGSRVGPSCVRLARRGGPQLKLKQRWIRAEDLNLAPFLAKPSLFNKPAYVDSSWRTPANGIDY